MGIFHLRVKEMEGACGQRMKNLNVGLQSWSSCKLYNKVHRVAKQWFAVMLWSENHWHWRRKRSRNLEFWMIHAFLHMVYGSHFKVPMSSLNVVEWSTKWKREVSEDVCIYNFVFFLKRAPQFCSIQYPENFIFHKLVSMSRPWSAWRLGERRTPFFFWLPMGEMGMGMGSSKQEVLGRKQSLATIQ